jgi:molybdopterin-guanine dinucleotide biosynthesis protein A
LKLAGLVLAGGRSSRFGTEKAAAQLDGRPLLVHAHAALAPHCEAVAVSAQPGSQAEVIARGLGLAVLPDEPAHPRGPLAGVVAGLAWAEAQGAEMLALAPCDTPRMGADALARLIAALGPGDDIAAAAAGGRLHALCAVLRVAAMRPLAATLDRGEHPPMQALWRSLALREVAFDDEARFANVNRPEDLAGLTAHPLDRPVWNGLATRHAGFARGGPLARRYASAHGVFVAPRDASDEAAAAVAALVRMA